LWWCIWKERNSRIFELKKPHSFILLIESRFKVAVKQQTSQ
jgi:hypothetical protein